jgi:hypothetical protein
VLLLRGVHWLFLFKDGFVPGEVRKAGIPEQHQCEECPDGKAAYAVQLDKGGDTVLVPLDDPVWIRRRWVDEVGSDDSEEEDEETEEDDEL